MIIADSSKELDDILDAAKYLPYVFLLAFTIFAGLITAIAIFIVIRRNKNNVDDADSENNSGPTT